VVVVAIVVTYFTAGATAEYFAGALGQIGGAMAAGAVGAAAGSVASQGVGIAIGAQDEFSWQAVAKAAVGGAVTGALFGVTDLQGDQVGGIKAINGNWVSSAKFGGAAPYIQAGLNRAGASALTQGASIALGLQDKFSWRAVAASAASGAVAAGVRDGMGLLDPDNASTFGGRVVNGTLSGLAGGVAYAVTTGGKVDYESIAADAFGNALGNSFVGGVTQRLAGELTPQERRMQSGDTYEHQRRLASGEYVPPADATLPGFDIALDKNPDIPMSLPMSTVELNQTRQPKAKVDSATAYARAQVADDWNRAVQDLDSSGLRRQVERTIGTQIDFLTDFTVDPTVAQYNTEVLRAQTTFNGRLTDSRLQIGVDPSTWQPGRSGSANGTVVMRPDGSQFIQDSEYLKPIANAEGLIQEQQRLWQNIDAAYQAIPFEVRTGKTQLQATADALSVGALLFGAGEVTLALRGFGSVATVMGGLSAAAEVGGHILNWNLGDAGKDFLMNSTFNALESKLNAPIITGLDLAMDVGQAINGAAPPTLPSRPSRDDLLRQMSDKEWAIKHGINPMIVDWGSGPSDHFTRFARGALQSHSI
jgi:hypothetical protein